jgi:hypothetical protein
MMIRPMVGWGDVDGGEIDRGRIEEKAGERDLGRDGRQDHEDEEARVGEGPELARRRGPGRLVGAPELRVLEVARSQEGRQGDEAGRDQEGDARKPRRSAKTAPIAEPQITAVVTAPTRRPCCAP